MKIKIISCTILLGVITQFSLFGQQEPQWLLPIYFETGDGQKDTVYIGYDPSASIYQHTVDPQFYDYEHFVYPDLEKFNAYVEQSLYYGEGNSVMKASIKSQLESHIYINFIGTGVSPITMKWDYSKLYSDGLPEYFIEIANRPRARIDVYPEVGGTCYPGCVDDCYFICTDSIYPEMTSYMTWDCQGVFADSLFVNCDIVQNVDQVLSLAIAVKRFDDYDTWWSEVNPELAPQSLLVFPNPTSGKVFIDNNINLEVENIVVYDCSGRQLAIFQSEVSNCVEIDLSPYEHGVYFLKFDYGSITQVEKILLFD